MGELETFKCEKCGKEIHEKYNGIAWCEDCNKEVLQREFDEHYEDVGY